jgi:hypothetical protein
MELIDQLVVVTNSAFTVLPQVLEDVNQFLGNAVVVEDFKSNPQYIL